MRRKFLMLFCAASLSAGLLAGCGSSEKKTDSTDTKTTEENASDETVEDEEVVSGFTDGADENGEEAGPNASSGDTSDEEGTASQDKILLNTDEPLSGIHHAEIVAPRTVSQVEARWARRLSFSQPKNMRAMKVASMKKARMPSMARGAPKMSPTNQE